MAGAASRVLVVDNEHPARTALSELLSGAGFVVETATSAADALAQMATFDPNVIVVDTGRVGGPDRDVVARLRAARHDAPIVLLCQEGSRPVSASSVPAVVRVTKPVDVDVLVGAILEMLVTGIVPLN